MKKTLCIHLLLFLCIFGANASPELRFIDSRIVDLGKIAKGKKIFTDIRYTNDGTGKLYITDTHMTCNCTSVDYPKEGIECGEEGIIHIVTDTKGKIGKQTIVVRLSTNGDNEESIIRIDFFVK